MSDCSVSMFSKKQIFHKSSRSWQIAAKGLLNSSDRSRSRGRDRAERRAIKLFNHIVQTHNFPHIFTEVWRAYHYAGITLLLTGKPDFCNREILWWVERARAEQKRPSWRSVQSASNVERRLSEVNTYLRPKVRPESDRSLFPDKLFNVYTEISDDQRVRTVCGTSIVLGPAKFRIWMVVSPRSLTPYTS